MPSATAPLETSTTCLSSCRRRAIRSDQRASASWSSPWPALVTRLLPTLTTRRFADATMHFVPADFIPTRLLFRDRGVRGRGRGLQVFHDRVAQLARSLSGERGDDKGFPG